MGLAISLLPHDRILPSVDDHYREPGDTTLDSYDVIHAAFEEDGSILVLSSATGNLLETALRDFCNAASSPELGGGIVLVKSGGIKGFVFDNHFEIY